MVKECIRGLMFVVKMHSLKEPAQSRFVFSPRTKLILARNSIFGEELEVEDR